jgi:hypothetical protein
LQLGPAGSHPKEFWLLSLPVGGDNQPMRGAWARPSTGKRFAMSTTAIAVILAYPVALVIVRNTPIIRQAITVIVIAPLVASVVVRTYGW